jgi:predicted AlkP superfamily phosphohydrolase/phosphomutase
MDKKSFVSALGDTEKTIRRRLQGSCFWDIVGNSGKKVCILFPHAVYPAWPVNGVMVCRSMQAMTKDYPPLLAYPESIRKEYNLRGLNTLDAVSSQNKSSLFKVIDDSRKLLEDEFTLGIKLMQKDRWDLLFLYTSVLDAIQHCFWNYCDKNDPTYVEDNPFGNIIKEFYILLDKKIGEIISIAGQDTTVVVFSDHGHGMRPVKLVNINEVLRQKGYLIASRTGANRNLITDITKIIKSALERIVVSSHSLEVLASKFLSYFPWAKRAYAIPGHVDWDKTVACVSDLSGIKAYSYGGIAIRKDRMTDSRYEEVCTTILEMLSNLKEPDTGQKLVKWCSLREDIYSGEFVNRYPDIVFQLEEGYGIGWSINTSLIGTSQTHGVHPGAHRMDSPVFLISEGKEKISYKDTMTLMDIVPTVLDLLSVEGSKFNFDGESIFK